MTPKALEFVKAPGSFVVLACFLYFFSKFFSHGVFSYTSVPCVFSHSGENRYQSSVSLFQSAKSFLSFSEKLEVEQQGLLFLLLKRIPLDWPKSELSNIWSYLDRFWSIFLCVKLLRSFPLTRSGNRWPRILRRLLPPPPPRWNCPAQASP